MEKEYVLDKGVFLDEPTREDVMSLIKKNRKFSKVDIYITGYSTYKEYDVGIHLPVHIVDEVMFYEVLTKKKYMFTRNPFGQFFLTKRK